MLFKSNTREYEVRENETVRQLRQRVERDLDISVWWQTTALLQDGRELSDAVTLGEVDLQKPLVFVRR